MTGDKPKDESIFAGPFRCDVCDCVMVPTMTPINRWEARPSYTCMCCGNVVWRLVDDDNEFGLR